MGVRRGGRMKAIECWLGCQPTESQVTRPWALLGAALLLFSLEAIAQGRERQPTLLVAQDGGAAQLEADECPVRFTITASDYRRWGSTSYQVLLIGVLRNTGTQTITLVAPGDGSTSGVRTPRITLQVETAEGTPHPLHRGTLIDGQINSLRREEVFDLPAGESRLIESWLGVSGITEPGAYEISVEYWNDPGMEWTAAPLGRHDSSAMERVRASTPCRVTSNNLRVEVPERR